MHLIEFELREIQMKEEGLGSRQIIVLGEKDGEREFPIIIGFAEALALDLDLHGYVYPRPMTHDLIFNVMEGLKAELKHVVVDDLRDGTFFGKLVVRTADDTEEWIDSRPSDAIVLATKKKVPIYVNEQILERILNENE
ncbi:MAG TPA: bifunctional nuclease family protein [Candidatus Sumerlaeota bacterium]|nr:MAG: hypothetical protein BWZ08_02268 [candidate division BRC1 bacterium ADurb.BinA292]HOE95191.1 bifunctional nuclease family protein [Candidatus Sumerlaeota bacterium]HOR27285.1 bifunctional nuclease family protein [Candidatus Sumerlaeota bacterium]HPK03919.1 bifunctional nuclease family protein [Candidatus Sumerlaeota bacterium]